MAEKTFKECAEATVKGLVKQWEQLPEEMGVSAECVLRDGQRELLDHMFAAGVPEESIDDLRRRFITNNAIEEGEKAAMETKPMKQTALAIAEALAASMLPPPKVSPEQELDANYMETLSKIQDPNLKAKEKAKWKEAKTKRMLRMRHAKEAEMAAEKPKRKWSRGVR